MENKIKLIINPVTNGSLSFNPQVYEGWTNINIEKSLENLSGSFSLGMTQLFNTDNVINGFTAKEGDGCIITIDDNIILTGFIDNLDIGYSADSHSIQVSGRDKASDLIDSSLIGNSDLNAPYDAQQLVEHILRLLGLNLEVFLTTGTDIIYNEDFDSGAGKNAWEQLDKYLQKKSLFATTDVAGDINLFRGSFGQTNQSLFHLIQGGNVNNILRGNKTSSINQRFNKISVLSQSSSLTSRGNFYNQNGTAIDSTIRTTKQLEIVSNASMTSAECQDLADFQKNIRQARGSSYTYDIQGFRQINGDLWLPNYEIYVKDEFYGIADNFLIKKVNLRRDLENGSITTLTLVDKLAYTLREPVAITNDGAGGLDW
jgi:prophage tail gpP-like protein